MKRQLDQIYNRKKKLISNLKKTRNEYIATVFDGLIKKKSVSEIHKDIQKISKTKGEGFYLLPMEQYTLALANKVKKQAVDIDGILFADVIFKLFNKQDVFTETNTIAFEEAKRYESDNKIYLIKDAMDNGARLGKVFYLISKHRDCAKDHVDYQGKIYVDENWESIITNSEAKARISKYIRDNNIKTFQWVIGEPVWMITRPNCRHYFKQLFTEDVLKFDVRTLLRRNNMSHREGRKETQTLKTKVYTKDDVLDIIRRYEERLAFHKALLEKAKNSQILRKAIAKDKFLIQKWKEYLQKMS